MQQQNAKDFGTVLVVYSMEVDQGMMLITTE